MGTTKVKIIDLSSGEQEIKTSQKHAQNLASVNKIKKEKPSEDAKDSKTQVSQKVEKEAPQKAAAIDKDQKTTETKKPKGKKRLHRHHLGVKYLAAKNQIEKDKVYDANEAFDLLTKTSYTKFNPTVEVHLNVIDKTLKGIVNFPHATGPQKEKKYLIFSDKKVDLKNVIWANENTITDIESGKLKPKRDFDSVIASPKFMPILAKVAKILGPAGMMPNPKEGTIAENPESAIEAKNLTGVEYRTDPQAPLIHTKIGKLSEKPQHLKENLKALVLSIGPTKIKRATLTSTMGPGIKVDISNLN